MHRHRFGCGRPAFRWAGTKPAAGEVFRKGCLQHLDGSPMLFERGMRCDSCGHPLIQPGALDTLRVEYFHSDGD
jgi:hypothetical protein